MRQERRLPWLSPEFWLDLDLKIIKKESFEISSKHVLNLQPSLSQLSRPSIRVVWLLVELREFEERLRSRSISLFCLVFILTQKWEYFNSIKRDNIPFIYTETTSITFCLVLSSINVTDNKKNTWYHIIYYLRYIIIIIIIIIIIVPVVGC